jgi:hypothetical protein
VSFDPAFFSTLRTITLTSGQLPISASINVVGPAVGVKVSGGNSSRVFSVDNDGSFTPTLTRLTITGGNGNGANGGGVWVQPYAALAMTGCRVRGNSSPASGGGIHAGDQSTLTLENCAVVDNVAGSNGVGIGSTNTLLTLTNVTIGANSAQADGGGMSMLGGEFEMGACTITENSAGSVGGGMYLFLTEVDVGNTAIAGNFDLSSNLLNHADISALSTVFDFTQRNFIGSNASVSGFFPAGQPGPDGNYASTASNPLDARLHRTDRGGDTYYEFQLGNSLIDNGANVFATAATDQRGHARIYNGTVDIGAIEMDLIAVTNTNSSGAGSLRQALSSAAGLGHGTISFAPGGFSVPRTIVTAGTEYAISAPVVI